MSSTTAEPAIHPSASVHPRATVDPTAVIAEGARIDADAIVGPHCTIGPRTHLRPRAIVVMHTALGADNVLHPYAVVGDDPQDRAFDPKSPGRLIVGDANVFREGFTAHRSTEPGPPTVIGSRNYFMVQTHVGHNAVVGDDNTLANTAMLAGHAHIGDRNTFSACTAVHQFTSVGDLCMCQAHSGVSMHLVPYTIMAGINGVVGLNTVGLRRAAHLTDADRAAIKDVFRALFRHRGARPLLDAARAQLDAGHPPAAERLAQFVVDAMTHEDGRRARRGCAGLRD